MMRPKINRPVPQRMKPAPSLPASSVDSSLRTEASVVIAFSFFSSSLHLLNRGGRPGAVQHRLVGPIATEVQRERAVGCGQPIGFLVLAGRRCAGIERERAISVVLQRLVLRAK